jgi:8-oxo-dGTP diphosphatase
MRGVRLGGVVDGQITVDHHHVVAGVLVDAGTVLLCRRSAKRQWYPNVWDLPGGHIETGETARVALVRELDEELGISIPEPKEPAFAHLRHRDFDCLIWIVREWHGTPHLVSEEHSDMGWWTPGEVVDLPMAVEDYLPLLTRAVLEVRG